MTLLDYISRAKPDNIAHLNAQGRSATVQNQIKCRCGGTFCLTSAFRCLYCGEWFCEACAEKHFGKTVKQWIDEKEVKTWEEWAELFGNIILDPDGFRDLPMDHLYAEKEYKSRVGYCTQMLKLNKKVDKS